MFSEQLHAPLFMQVTLDCLSFKRRMVPMEHLKEPPVVYGKWFSFPRVLFLLIWLGFFPIYISYHLMHQTGFFGMDFENLVVFVMNNQPPNFLSIFSPWWKRFILSNWLFCICHRVEIFKLMLNNNSLGYSECTVLNLCIEFVHKISMFIFLSI